MNLEQLQAMSDSELNELSAVKVMGYGYRGYCEKQPKYPYVSPDPNGKLVLYDEEVDFKHWNPTTDMNDAMELWDKLHSQGWELNLSCDKKITTPWDCRLFLTDKDYNVSKRIIVHNKTAPRAITIASILALE